MTVQEAERKAIELLDSVAWWTTDARDTPLPIDPIDIARRLGLAVFEKALPADESGKIEISPGQQAVITLNTFDHKFRQRFTCAHEIGHYVHRGATWAGGPIIDYRSTLAGMGINSEEIYANQFAAALLMPAHLVTRAYQEHRDVDALAFRFDTSVQAMAVRLKNLRLR